MIYESEMIRILVKLNSKVKLYFVQGLIYLK